MLTCFGFLNQPISTTCQNFQKKFWLSKRVHQKWNDHFQFLTLYISVFLILFAFFLSHQVVSLNGSMEQCFRQSWPKATQIVSHIWGKIYELFVYNKSHLRPVGGSSGKMPAVSMPDENILMVPKIFCLFCSFNLFFQSVGFLINYARMSCNLFGVVICVWLIVAMAGLRW